MFVVSVAARYYFLNCQWNSELRSNGTVIAGGKDLAKRRFLLKNVVFAKKNVVLGGFGKKKTSLF